MTTDALARGRPGSRPLWLALSIALAANIMAGVLLAMDVATKGDDELFQILTGLDLLSIAIAVLFGFGKLQGAATQDAKQDAELASLSRAKLSAESANRAKSRYLATISHEIRSPLNAIYGYAQLVEVDDGVSPQEAAKVIRRCAEHLTSLVEGLLDISQLEFGVLRVRNEEVRFSAFIDQLLSMMRHAAASKGLDFIYIPPERMPDYVRLDQSRLRQILINLISNAIKFTHAGSVTLQIRYSGQIATFEVRDTGPGIAPENLERIFEPFEQIGDADEDANAKNPQGHSGAGLGLAIARAIVDILGGKLELESEVGVGTCFRVTMMLSEVTGKGLAQVASRKVSGYEGARRSILLVEDDADQRLFLERLLRSLRFEVTACASGEAALANEAGQHADLAILDISLPGISGWETAMGLREQLGERRGEDLKILMLSANSDELHRPETKTPMHDLFLVKPVEFDAVVEAIGGLLNMSWRWDVPGALPDQSMTQDAAPQVLASQTFGDGARAHVGRLVEYLRIGYVRGIEAEIQALEDSAPEAKPLVDRLYACLDRYDLAGMAKLLQDH
jgi:signal transduction histidine kinase/CheY-like chemotaxis protein